MKNPRGALLLIVMLLLAAATRSRGLAGKDVWVDEAITWHYADMPFLQALKEVARFDAHPPLFYMLAWLGHRLLPGALGIRLPSFLAGLALPFLIHALALKTEGRGTATRALILACASSYLTYFSHEARNYCISSVLACLCALLLLRLKERPSPRLWALWCLLCLISLYTYVYLGLLLAVLALWWISDRSRWTQECLVGWVLSHAVAGLIFLPWFLVITQLPGVQQRPDRWIPGFGAWDLVRLVNTFSIGPHQYLSETLQSGPFPPIALATPWAGLLIAGLWLARNRRMWALILVAGPALVWILPVHLHAFDPKHLFFLFPFFLLCQATAMERIRSFPLQGIAMGCLILFNVASYAWYESDSVDKAGWNDATFMAAKDGRSHDVVVFDPFYVGYAFDFHVPRDCSIRNRVGPAGEDQAMLKELAEAIQPDQRVWLFSSQGPVTSPCDALRQWLADRRPLVDEVIFRPAECVETLRVILFDEEAKKLGAGG